MEVSGEIPVIRERTGRDGRNIEATSKKLEVSEQGQLEEDTEPELDPYDEWSPLMSCGATGRICKGRYQGDFLQKRRQRVENHLTYVKYAGRLIV